LTVTVNVTIDHRPEGGGLLAPAVDSDHSHTSIHGETKGSAHTQQQEAELGRQEKSHFVDVDGRRARRASRHIQKRL
jgi:hypothetical protein